MARRAPVAVICVLSAALLPGFGCPPGFVAGGPGDAKQGKFTATGEMKQVDPGTVKFEPPGRTVKGTVWKGSFTANPNDSATEAAKQMGLKLGSGKVVGKYDGKEDYSIGKASATGFQLITFKNKETGSICVKVAYSSTDHGETYTGTFKSVGGTRKLAKVKASGTMTAKNENPGSPGPGKVSGKGSASKLDERDGLPAACKALKDI